MNKWQLCLNKYKTHSYLIIFKESCNLLQCAEKTLQTVGSRLKRTKGWLLGNVKWLGERVISHQQGLSERHEQKEEKEKRLWKDTKVLTKMRMLRVAVISGEVWPSSQGKFGRHFVPMNCAGPTACVFRGWKPWRRCPDHESQTCNMREVKMLQVVIVWPCYSDYQL